MPVKPVKQCSVESCNSVAWCRGWCSKHYSRWKRYGEPETTKTKVRGLCSIQDCGKPHAGKGFCGKHLRRFRLHGDPEHLSRNPAHSQIGGCYVEGCSNKKVCHGLCDKHRQRLRKYGDPLLGYPSPVANVDGKSKKQWLRDYKIEKGCYDCGYKGHHSALDFDHLPGELKVGAIQSGSGWGWAALIQEVNKCDVVCANCHRIRTYNRVQFRKGA